MFFCITFVSKLQHENVFILTPVVISNKVAHPWLGVASEIKINGGSSRRNIEALPERAITHN